MLAHPHLAGVEQALAGPGVNSVAGNLQERRRLIDSEQGRVLPGPKRVREECGGFLECESGVHAIKAAIRLLRGQENAAASAARGWYRYRSRPQERRELRQVHANDDDRLRSLDRLAMPKLRPRQLI